MFWSKLGIELLWRFTSLLFQTFDLMIFDYAQKPLCSRSGQSLWSIKLPLFLNVKTDLCNISDRTHLLPYSKICRIFSSFLCISTFWNPLFLPLDQFFQIPKSNIFENFSNLIKVIINFTVIMQSFLFIIFNKLIISHICISVSLNPNFLSLQIFPQVQQVPSNASTTLLSSSPKWPVKRHNMISANGSFWRSVGILLPQCQDVQSIYWEDDGLFWYHQ